MNEDILTSAFRKIKAKIVGNESSDDIQDSLQEAFCRLWSRKETIADGKQAEGMLAVAAKNIRIDMLRRRNVHPEVNIEAIREAVCHEMPEDASEVYREIDTLIRRHLTDRDREILLRRDRDGWEFEEIAEHYDISTSNARVITARCRKKIRELYIDKIRNTQ